MLTKYKKQIEPIIFKIVKPISFIHPNILSFGSFIIAAPGFYFYTQGNALFGSLFLFGVMFDAFDGAVARLTGKTSSFGGVLDATLDRIFEGILLLCIGIGGLVSWPLIFISYIIFISISYIKAKAEAVTSLQNVGTNQFSVGILERTERILIIFLASILNQIITLKDYNLMTIAFIIMIVLGFITLAWRSKVIYKFLET